MFLRSLCLITALFILHAPAFANCEQPVVRWTQNLSKNGYTIKWLDEPQKKRLVAFAQRNMTNPPPDLDEVQAYPAFAMYQTGDERLGAPNKGGVAFTDQEKTCVFWHFSAAGDTINRLVNYAPAPVIPPKN